jgi:hypothetical protein
MAQGDWAGLINTTTAQFIPGVSERNIFRNRKSWALARQQGRIFFDGNGRYQDWKVEYSENPLRPYGADTNLVYPRLNRYFTAQLEWRGYSGTDSMGVMEQAQNKGAAALIQMYGEKAEKLLESLTRHLADEVYVDGTDPNNALRFHGLLSFLGYTIDSGTYTIRGQAGLHRPTALPASFYATKPCTLGGLGGSWSGIWPEGTGDTEYDAWAPIITHYGSDYFSGTPTWKANATSALKYHIVQAGRKSEMDMNAQGQTSIQLITMTSGMFWEWLEKLEDKERVVIDPSGGLLRQLGFTNGVVNYMGVDCTWEYANPADNFFSWNFPSMRITSLMPQMFTPYGPYQDQDNLGSKWAVLVLGNIRCNPCGFGRGVPS